MAHASPQAGSRTGYSGAVAELYDLVHQGKGKDYAREAADLAALVREHSPEAASLLDVACGTGQHLRHLAGSFDVAGVELSADMLAIARRRNPDAALHHGDMRDFALDRRFSAVTCLFSSIGHMADSSELASALARFSAHVLPDGVVVVEPWWFPETFTPGFVGASTAESEGCSVTRVSHSTREGDATRIEVHYLVAQPDDGIRHHVETHLITLFTRAQYERAFRDAGLAVAYVPGGPSGRGLFLGTPETKEDAR